MTVFSPPGKEDFKIIRRIYPGKVSQTAYCDCPNAEPGKIKLDASAHLSGCRFRKKILTGRFTQDSCVTPEQFKDGYLLGVALTN